MSSTLTRGTTSKVVKAAFDAAQKKYPAYFKMSTKGRERRDVMAFLLGTGAGAFGLERFENSKTSNLISLRTKQVADYYSFLRENGSLEKYHVNGPTYWFEGALVAADGQGTPKLILPFKPTVTLLEAIGVEKNGERSIRLAGISASLVNIEDGKRGFDEAFHYQNIDEARNLSDLPSIDVNNYFHSIHFWTRGARILIDETRALKDLDFSLSVYYDTYKLIADNIVRVGFLPDEEIGESHVVSGMRSWESAAISLDYSILQGSDPSVIQPAAIESPRHGAVISQIHPSKRNLFGYSYYLLI